MKRARFQMCRRCPKHGRIVLPDGHGSQEICFKEYGLHLVRVSLLIELTPEEAGRIAKELEASPLPQRADEVNLDILYSVESLNHLQALLALEEPRFPALPLRLLHALIHEPNPDPVPDNFLSTVKRSLAAVSGCN